MQVPLFKRHRRSTSLEVSISEAFSLSTLALASKHRLLRTFLPDATHEVTVPYSFALLRDWLNPTSRVVRPL